MRFILFKNNSFRGEERKKREKRRERKEKKECDRRRKVICIFGMCVFFSAPCAVMRVV